MTYLEEYKVFSNSKGVAKAFYIRTNKGKCVCNFVYVVLSISICAILSIISIVDLLIGYWPQNFVHSEIRVTSFSSFNNEWFWLCSNISLRCNWISYWTSRGLWHHGELRIRMNHLIFSFETAFQMVSLIQLLSISVTDVFFFSKSIKTKFSSKFMLVWHLMIIFL